MELGRLLDETGYVLVALAAESNGPVHRGALANFVLPVRADFWKNSRSRIYVVPLPSETVNDNDVIRGRFTPLLALAMTGSFHLEMRPKKMPTSASGVKLSEWSLLECCKSEPRSKHRGECRMARAVLVFVSFQLIVIHSGHPWHRNRPFLQSPAFDPGRRSLPTDNLSELRHSSCDIRRNHFEYMG